MRYFVLTQTKSDVFLITLNVTPIARLVWLLVEKCEIFWKCSQSKGFWASLTVFSGMVQYNPMEARTKFKPNPNTFFFSHFVNFSKCQKDSPLLLLRGSQQQKWTTLSTFSKKKMNMCGFCFNLVGTFIGLYWAILESTVRIAQKPLLWEHFSNFVFLALVFFFTTGGH